MTGNLTVVVTVGISIYGNVLLVDVFHFGVVETEIDSAQDAEKESADVGKPSDTAFLNWVLGGNIYIKKLLCNPKQKEKKGGNAKDFDDKKHFDF